MSKSESSIGTSRNWAICLSFVLLLPFSAESFTQRTMDFQGQVISSVDQKEITGAIVRIDGTQARRQLSSDRQGRFRFSRLPAGTYQIRVTAQGYQTYISSINLINFSLINYRVRLHPEENRTLTTKAVNPVVSVRVAAIPDSARKAFGKGAKELHEKDRPKRSLEHFQKAIELYTDYDEAYVQLGIAYSLLENDQEAVETFQRAVEVYPENARAYAFWGKHDYGQSRLEEAVEHLSKAVELYPNFWLAHKDLSRVLGEAGRVEEAYTHASRAHKLHTEDSRASSRPAEDVHLVYYNACVNSGRLADGLTEINEFLELFPKSDVAKSMRAMRDKLAEKITSSPP